MNFFSKEPIVKKKLLKKEYKFMYESFVLSHHSDLYLVIEERNGIVSTLKFQSSLYKYGYPNDEVSHPLAKYGLGVYDFFEVENSPWIEEIKMVNRAHPRHRDSMFNNQKHYIAAFKDEVFEVICSSFEEVELTTHDILKFVSERLQYWETD
jgi:hypothetical protein